MSERCPRSGTASEASVSLVVVDRSVSDLEGIRFLLYAPGVAVLADEGSLDESRVLDQGVLPAAGVIADSAIGVTPGWIGVWSSAPGLISCGEVLCPKLVTSLREDILAVILAFDPVGGENGGLIWLVKYFCCAA
jgi:hypothetical protein